MPLYSLISTRIHSPNELFIYRDGRTRFKSNWVYGVICTNDECNICVLEVIIDFIHLQHNWASVSHDHRGPKVAHYHRGRKLLLEGRCIDLACAQPLGELRTATLEVEKKYWTSIL